MSRSECAARFARSTPRESSYYRRPVALDQSRHESFLAEPGVTSVLHFPSTTAIFKPAALQPCAVHPACTAHTQRATECFTTATRVAAPDVRDTGTYPGSRAVPSAASSDESRTRVERSLRVGYHASVEARCASLIRHFCLCSGRHNRPLGRGHARGIYPTRNVAYVARIGRAGNVANV